ncbi:MAG: serine/threonine-protein kinase [Myxococcota bacterium]
MSDDGAAAEERPTSADPPWGDEITPLTEVCGGQYVLLHEIARGDLSIVYRAKPSGQRESIAFKVIQPRYVDDEVQTRRFRREAELLTKVEHPNIVRLIDHGSIEDGRDFVALELLTGQTLAEALAVTPRVSPERTCRIMRQAARALRAMHLAGVIHRDLQPENILLIGPEDGERVKLVDFSRAGDVGAPVRRSRKDRPQSGEVGEGPTYRAPEQVRKRSPTASMDVFAFGVIAFEMLAGEHPFAEPEPGDEARVAGHTGPTIRSKAFDAPEELLGLVADCIKDDPDKRPSSMDEVIERIDKALLWMGVVPHEGASDEEDEDARTQLWSAADPDKVESRAGKSPRRGGRTAARGHDERDTTSPEADTADDQPVASRRRRPEPAPEPEAPEPSAESRVPTGPEPEASQNAETDSVSAMDRDELEGQETMDDESPVVVDTVAWTKPEPVAERERRAAASPRASRRSRDSSAEQPTKEPSARPRATQTRRPTSNHPPVPALPRWAFPLVISVIGLLAYGVWMVWTA